MTPALHSLTSVDRADVYKSGQRAGSLQRSEDGVGFAYNADYLRVGLRAVATTLPLTDQPFQTGRAGAVPAFFAGLLPEGRRLSALRLAVKTSLDDELSLLLAIGNDTVGDVQVVPAGSTPTALTPLVSVQREWSEVRFATVLAESGVVDPVGLAGVQDKASARMILVPVAKAGERYLLKLDPPEYPHVVANEAFFLRMARDVGLDVATAEVVVDADERPGLLVRRFDRLPQTNGTTQSLGCEDACQLLGLWPEAKYRVGTEQIAARLGQVCAARPAALLAFFEQVVFAWLSGNGDAHAKNFSVLAGADGEWTVSPAYDLVSTLAYGDRTFALSVQRKRTGLSRKRLLAFAAEIGLPARASERALDRLVERCRDLADQVADHPWAYRSDVVARWVAELRYRHRHLQPTG